MSRAAYWNNKMQSTSTRTHTHTRHGHESNAPTFNHSMIAMGFTTAFFLRYLNKLSVACGLPILNSQPPPQPSFHVADALAFCVLLWHYAIFDCITATTMMTMHL